MLPEEFPKVADFFARVMHAMEGKEELPIMVITLLPGSMGVYETGTYGLDDLLTMLDIAKQTLLNPEN